MSIVDDRDLTGASTVEDLASSSSTRLNVVFAMHCEPGHGNASFGLARRLRDRGHRVTYLGLTDSRKLVIGQGFEFVPFAEDILPEGTLQESTEPLSGSTPNLLGWFQRRLAKERLLAEFLRRLSNGHLDKRLLSCEPDLLLCDTCVWYVALRAMLLGIPTVNVSVCLSGHPNAHIPPFNYARIPHSSWWGRMQVRADWLRLRCQFFFTRRLASILLGRFRSPARMHILTYEFLRLAKRSGFLRKENRTYRFSELGLLPILPEIALPPRAFDFPHTPVIERLHFGDFVDLTRNEDANLLDQLDQQKPLVYCSLGSVPSYYPHSGHFFRTVVAASRQRQDWQWVLSVGTQQQADKLNSPGSNLLVVKWAPQLSMLRRAAAMVTHGGINSITECIHFGVPMVIVPGLRDQPGNTARAVYHGIALTASMKDVTAGELVKLVESAMHSADLRQALARMKNRIVAENGAEAAVEMIEATARAGQRRATKA
jgi:UDP:flavonoid glycosyltransferase YjiC (YdhE family)